jgi:predicted nucleic acid-binding Zn ribbon protein
VTPGDEPRPLGAALDRLLGHLGAPPARVVSRLEAVWPEVAGPGLAGCSRPVSLRQAVLVVQCSEPAWAAQLRWMEAELCRRLTEALDGEAVTTIRVRHAPEEDGAEVPRW